MYGKEEAILMGEIWNLQKQKVGEINHTDEWWQTTIAEFNAIAEKAKEKTCIGYHCIAALRDIDAKATGREIDETLSYLGEMTMEQFADYLPDAHRGDSVKINGRIVEIR